MFEELQRKTELVSTDAQYLNAFSFSDEVPSIFSSPVAQDRKQSRKLIALQIGSLRNAYARPPILGILKHFFFCPDTWTHVFIGGKSFQKSSTACYLQACHKYY